LNGRAIFALLTRHSTLRWKPLDVWVVVTPLTGGLFHDARYPTSFLLPSLIRLKLPGFEANLQAGIGEISSGPTGDVVLGSDRVVVVSGPSGRPPRGE
jgi:hypothetical protein